MGARLRSWWQKTRKSPAVFGFIALLGVAIALIFVEVRLYGTGFAGKTLWDWLQLLIIPAVLAVGGYVINLTISRSEQEATKQRAQSERVAAEKRADTEREIALDSLREEVLQAYIDKMAELLFKEHLSELKPEYKEVRKIARVRTLTVLPRLDGLRKGSVLQFLHESGLIEKDKRIIDLRGANLGGASLEYADLRGAYLFEAALAGASITSEQLATAIEEEEIWHP
jgi:Pentapeptide repeats (8 copies)